MNKEFNDWIISTYHKLLPSLSTERVRVLHEATALTDWEIDRIIFSDVSYAIGSLVMVLLLMWVHSGSFLLSAGGLVHILLSIPSAYFVIRIIMQV